MRIDFLVIQDVMYVLNKDFLSENITDLEFNEFIEDTKNTYKSKNEEFPKILYERDNYVKLVLNEVSHFENGEPSGRKRQIIVPRNGVASFFMTFGYSSKDTNYGNKINNYDNVVVKFNSGTATIDAVYLQKDGSVRLSLIFMIFDKDLEKEIFVSAFKEFKTYLKFEMYIIENTLNEQIDSKLIN